MPIGRVEGGDVIVSGRVSDYEPIDCSVHDKLLARATSRTLTDIVYRGADGTDEGERVVQGTIVDVFARDGAEYLHVADEDSRRIEIRLDRIQSFGDGTP